MPQYWFLDLDETLITAGFSWGMQTAVPRLIERHQLPFDEAKFKDLVLMAIKRSAHETDQMAIARDLFLAMDWSPTLIQELMEDMQANYRPSVFEDTIPFLEKLKANEAKVVVISNNRRAEDLIAALSIDLYIDQVFTPAHCDNCQPKPHVDLWNCVKRTFPDMDDRAGIMVGDDPRVDGKFAEACNLQCWMIDRTGRLQSVQQEFDYGYVQSLLEIPV